MDETPLNIVILAFEVIVAMLVVGFIGYASFVGNQMTKVYQQEADISLAMSEYAAFNKYDNTIVSGSNVAEAILMYASDDFSVVLIVDSGATSIMDEDEDEESGKVPIVYPGSPPTSLPLSALSLSALTSGTPPRVDIGKDYSSRIIMDNNDVVIGIVFEVI